MEQRKGRWEIRENKKGYFYVVFIASNGNVLFHTEDFDTKNKAQSKFVARKTIDSIKRQVFLADDIIEVFQ